MLLHEIFNYNTYLPNVRQKHSGINAIMWFGVNEHEGKQLQHWIRSKITVDNDEIVLKIKSPNLIDGIHKIVDKKIRNATKQFIQINYQHIVDLWNKHINHSEFLNRITNVKHIKTKTK